MPISVDRYMNVLTFEDINIQYVGEDFCTLKAFLWDSDDSLKPLAPRAEKVLIKNHVE